MISPTMLSNSRAGVGVSRGSSCSRCGRRSRDCVKSLLRLDFEGDAERAARNQGTWRLRRAGPCTPCPVECQVNQAEQIPLAGSFNEFREVAENARGFAKF